MFLMADELIKIKPKTVRNKAKKVSGYILVALTITLTFQSFSLLSSYYYVIIYLFIYIFIYYCVQPAAASGVTTSSVATVSTTSGTGVVAGSAKKGKRNRKYKNATAAGKCGWASVGG